MITFSKQKAYLAVLLHCLHSTVAGAKSKTLELGALIDAANDILKNSPNAGQMTKGGSRTQIESDLRWMAWQVSCELAKVTSVTPLIAKTAKDKEYCRTWDGYYLYHLLCEELHNTPDADVTDALPSGVRTTLRTVATTAAATTAMQKITPALRQKLGLVLALVENTQQKKKETLNIFEIVDCIKNNHELDRDDIPAEMVPLIQALVNLP